MRFVVVATRDQSAPAEAFKPELMQAEAKLALKMWAEDFVREIYSRTDGKGAVIIIEAANEEEVASKLAELPLVKAGLLSTEIYGITAYRAISQMAES